MRADKTGARRLTLRRLLDRETVTSQAHAAALLRARGYSVSQATVSRDLAAMGAERRGGDGRYVVPPGGPPDDGRMARLRRVLETSLVSVASSGNLVVLKTPPAEAGPLAAAMDAAGVAELLGTLAGDDTVLAIASDPRGGSRLERSIMRVLEEGR